MSDEPIVLQHHERAFLEMLAGFEGGAIHAVGNIAVRLEGLGLIRFDEYEKGTGVGTTRLTDAGRAVLK